ncbi:MAG: winged helix-turn-helix transcriptional regulator [Chloroflexi bacterium]|nr:winged helix-turn-helix transcriptional regulator [Chloroflexota bacterium]MBK8023409.1 winged helix-turn-helix transcriptional regulator [Chloroflexota bacterium]
MNEQDTPTLIPVHELQMLHDNICQTLGDPKRIQLLYALSQGPRSVNALTELLEAPQSTVSRHLAVLRQRGLVGTERDGTTVVYSLAVPELVEIIDSMRGILRKMLAQQLESLSPKP